MTDYRLPITVSPLFGGCCFINRSERTMAEIIIDHSDGIAQVVFNRPEVRNALTFEMYDRGYDLFIGGNTNREIKAIIFECSRSSAFASGTDISLLHALASGNDG